MTLVDSLKSREEHLYRRGGCVRNEKGNWDGFDADGNLHGRAARRIAELEAAIREAIDLIESDFAPEAAAHLDRALAKNQL